MPLRILFMSRNSWDYSLSLNIHILFVSARVDTDVQRVLTCSPRRPTTIILFRAHSYAHTRLSRSCVLPANNDDFIITAKHAILHIQR